MQKCTRDHEYNTYQLSHNEYYKYQVNNQTILKVKSQSIAASIITSKWVKVMIGIPVGKSIAEEHV